MPPKNKKQAEEEAKRLEQQKKKKEEQQARLEIERKKYLFQTLSTGLILPVSAQLLIDFKHKSSHFVTQKLKQNLINCYPDALNLGKLQFIMKELHYYIKDACILFGTAEEGQNLIKQRIFIGILLNLLLCVLKQQQDIAKSKSEDEAFAKKLVTTHCNKMEGCEPLSKEDGLTILKYIKQKLYCRYLLIKLHNKFKKRQSQSQFNVYIETPCTYFNDETTVWTDLSEHSNQARKT